MVQINQSAQGLKNNIEVEKLSMISDTFAFLNYTMPIYNIVNGIWTFYMKYNVHITCLDNEIPECSQDVFISTKLKVFAKLQPVIIVV